MLGGKELRDLELRRRELVVQSSLNRLAFRIELQDLQTALDPAERIFGAVRAVRPWLLVLAPLAGIWAARRRRGNASVFSAAIGILRYIQPLLLLWKQLTSSASDATPETSPKTTVPRG